MGCSMERREVQGSGQEVSKGHGQEVPLEGCISPPEGEDQGLQCLCVVHESMNEYEEWKKDPEAQKEYILWRLESDLREAGFDEAAATAVVNQVKEEK